MNEHTTNSNTTSTTPFISQTHPAQHIQRDKTSQAIKIYISHSESDQSLEMDFETHLTPLRRQGLIDYWGKRQIIPGVVKDEVIKDHPYMAQIILFLVSPEFLASPDCYEKEVLPAVERQELDHIPIIPILLRECDWQSTPLGPFQPLPRNHKSVDSWRNPGNAWQEIVGELRVLCEALDYEKQSGSGSRLITDNSAATTEITTEEISSQRYTFIRSILKQNTAIWSLAFSPDGQYLVSGGDDGTINLWNMLTMSRGPLLKNYVRVTSSLAFSPDGQFLASGGDDGTIKL